MKDVSILWSNKSISLEAKTLTLASRRALSRKPQQFFRGSVQKEINLEPKPPPRNNSLGGHGTSKLIWGGKQNEPILIVLKLILVSIRIRCYPFSLTFLGSHRDFTLNSQWLATLKKNIDNISALNTQKPSQHTPTTCTHKNHKQIIPNYITLITLFFDFQLNQHKSETS